jgi:hypothetical protein
MTARRARRAQRLQDGIVVGLVVSVLALTATAPRAAPEGRPAGISVVQMPVAQCAAVHAARRSACLAVARTTLRH